MSDLHAGRRVVIPEDELEWRFSTSGGPGGQHANRSATRAELRFDLASSPSIPGDLRESMLARLGKRAPDGIVVVIADDSRSQYRNRQAARRRLTALLVDAQRVPKRRRPTAPTRASRARRLTDKKQRSAKKRLRQPPEND